MKRFIRIITVTISIGALMLFCSCMHTGGVIDIIQSAEPETSRVTSTKATKSTKAKSTKSEKTTSADETKEKEKATNPDKEIDENEQDLEANDYYDIIDYGAYVDSLGYQHGIVKVLGKENVRACGTIILYDEAGNIVEKSDDEIVLTKGEENFFEFTFEHDISNLESEERVIFKEDSFFNGERNGVEMVQYNQSGENLYIAFKQNVDELGGFEKFKILLYNGDKLVGSEIGFFNVYTDNLLGKGSTDIAELWVWGTDFDRIEYYYEP